MTASADDDIANRFNYGIPNRSMTRLDIMHLIASLDIT